MKIPFFFRLLLLFLVVLSGCGSADTPVSLNIPFSGALTNDTRIVVTNGAPVGGNTSLQLAIKSQQNEPECPLVPAVNSLNGAEAGECAICQNRDPAESTSYLEDERRDRFFAEAKCLIDGDEVSANLEVFDWPHVDEGIDVSSLVPEGEVGELRSGMGSGIIQFGEGAFLESPDRELMTIKYVAVSNLEEGIKTFFHHLEMVWFIDR